MTWGFLVNYHEWLPQELGSWKGIGEQWQYRSRVHLKRFNKIRHIFDKKRKKKKKAK